MVTLGATSEKREGRRRPSREISKTPTASRPGRECRGRCKRERVSTVVVGEPHTWEGVGKLRKSLWTRIALRPGHQKFGGM